MDFLQIDQVLSPWAKNLGLQIHTTHQGDEVRMVLVVDNRGDTYQLWVSPAESAGFIRVSVGLHSRAEGSTFHREREKFRLNLETTYARLGGDLDRAYDQIKMWISSAGHSLAPV